MTTNEKTMTPEEMVNALQKAHDESAEKWGDTLVAEKVAQKHYWSTRTALNKARKAALAAKP